MEMVGGMARREPGKTLRLTRVRIHHLESSVQDQGFRVQRENVERRISNAQSRKRLGLTRRNFLKMVKANFIAAREIVIEFVF
jgi:hypothetical protein